MRDLNRRIAAGATAALLICLLIARQIAESRTLNDFYQITEWRIFYPGHFIRRGLRGSTIDCLANLTSLDADTLIRVLSTASYAGLTAIATAYMFRWLWAGAKSWIPILLLSPVGLFFYLNAIMSIGRFDVLFALLTILHLEVCMRTKDAQTYTLRTATLFSTLGVLAVLCHEAFIFLALPVNAMLSLRRLGKFDARLIWIYALPAIATGASALAPVTPSDLLTLSRALAIPVGSLLWFNSPLSLVGLTPAQQVEFVGTLFTPRGLLPFLLTAGCFGAIHFTLLWRLVSASTVSESSRSWFRQEFVWRDLLAIPLICSLPLYALGVDYGRWFAMVVMTFTICCSRLLVISVPVKKMRLGWTVPALFIFMFVPVPLALRLPGVGDQLITWSGTAILGHFFGPARGAGQ